MASILVSYRGIPDGKGWATGDLLVDAFNQLGHHATPYGRYYQTKEPIDRIPLDKIDLLVCLECNDGDEQYWELSQLNCKKVYWEFDTTMHKDFSQAWIDFMKFDKVFFANYNVHKASPNSIYLPYAADYIHFKEFLGDKKDVLFAGFPFGPRAEFANQIGVKLTTDLFRGDYAAAIRSHKINIHNHASGGNGLLVMRIWETLSSRTCLLTEDDPVLYQHFVPGKHLVTYSDATDCKAKIEWLLANDRQREDIAIEGHRYVMENHTYRHRAQAILDALK